MIQKNIMCLVGTRPECIKMAPVIRKLQSESWARTTVVSTGQHRQLVTQILGLFGINVDYDLDVMEHDQTLAGLSSRIFAKLDPVFNQDSYDLLLVQGDTTSVMIASLTAFYRRIPVGHVEAGLRTHDINRPFPEELNRVVAGRVSTIHFAPTNRARDNLLAELTPPETIHVTGNTVVDALLDIAARDIPCNFPTSPDHRLILVTAHRRENFGEPLEQICLAIRDLIERHENVEFVIPVHPNPNIKGPIYGYLGDADRVHLIEPAGYQDLVALMKNSYLILTDSGGIQEEAPGLNKPVLVLRDETERPEAVEAGVARLIGANRRRIVDAVSLLLTNEQEYLRMAKGGSPYGDGNAADKIANLCHALLIG